jgi:GWxTD domain-containing protein
MPRGNDVLKKKGWLRLILVLASLSPGPAVGQRREHAADPFAKWLKEDVVYIISGEEKSVFDKLSTSEEKESFIEQFWRRRDTDPTTPENEFKEEHYRRVAYANDTFRDAGIPGWKTDRGRVYIVFGPPTNRERYSAGAMYQRPLHEGGGSTRTYPFEKWYYNHIDGIGDGIELEFVDPTMTGGFRLALRPEEKDALLHMPGGGQTFYEMIGAETRQGRIKTMGPMRTLGTEGEGSYRQLSNPFVKLGTYFQLQRNPDIKFSDLRASIRSRVTFTQFPVTVSNSYLVLNTKAFLVPITATVPTADLTYKDTPGGSRRATVHLYGSVQGVDGRLFHEFDETLYSDRDGRQVPTRLYFQKQLPLVPGVYKATIVARDAESGRIGVTERRLELPGRLPAELALSSLVLADYIVPAPGSSLPEPFATARGWKVYPSIDGTFPARTNLGLYFEVYGFAVDTSAFTPELDVVTRVRAAAGGLVRDAPDQHTTTLLSDRVLVAMVFKLEKLAAGDYELEVEIRDKIAGQKTVRKAPFRVAAEAAGPDGKSAVR